MGILTKNQIVEYLKKGELLTNPCKKGDGEFDVEPASYDFRAGTIIWKDTNITTGESTIQKKFYDPDIPFDRQDQVTLQPGQVMFVITFEEVKMPLNLCGTVYAKNKFSRDGILALTTGHIDPGIECPIVIRLINLRSIPYTFHLGEPIYTIVFHTLEIAEEKDLCAHEKRTMEQTFAKTVESANAALGNALNDISLTHDLVRKADFDKLTQQAQSLVKKDELEKLISKYIRRWGWTFFLYIAAILALIASIVKIVEYIQKQFPSKTAVTRTAPRDSIPSRSSHPLVITDSTSKK